MPRFVAAVVPNVYGPVQVVTLVVQNELRLQMSVLGMSRSRCSDGPVSQSVWCILLPIHITLTVRSVYGIATLILHELVY